MFYPKLFPVSLLYYCIVYVNLVKDRSSCDASVFRKVVAKVRSFSHILQIFAELFSKFFSEPGSGVRFSKAGAKVRSCFQTAKCFAKFFFESFSKAGRRGSVRLGLSCERRDSNRNSTGEPRAKLLCNITSSINASFPKAGAKVRLITGSANLLGLFLEGLAKILCKRLIYKYVIKQDFHERKRRDKEGTHYNISGGRALRARITITIRGKGHTISAFRMQTGREQGVHGMKTGCEQEENSDLHRGKR